MQIISETQYVFALEDPSRINHLVVFLTGQAGLPGGFVAVIHYNTDVGIASGHPWVRLGHLANERPSAIFRVASGIPPEARVVDIGISVEPFGVETEACTEVVLAKQCHQGRPEAAQKAVESLYNYVASFAQPAASVSPPSTSVVPTSALNTWYTINSRRSAF